MNHNVSLNLFYMIHCKKVIYPLPSRCGETWCIYICRTESIVWPFRRGIVNATVFCPIKIVINPWLGRCGDVRMVMFLTPGLRMRKISFVLLLIRNLHRFITTEARYGDYLYLGLKRVWITILTSADKVLYPLLRKIQRGVAWLKK